MAKTNPISVRLNDSEKAELEIAADEECEGNVSFLVRRIVRKWLDQRRKAALREKGKA